MIRQVLATFFIFFCSLSASSQSQVSNLDSLDLEKGVWLKNKWFYQNATLSDFDVATSPSAEKQWYAINLDSINNITKVIPGYTGAGWFRISLLPDSNAHGDYLGLRLYQNAASEIFINGVRYYKLGRFTRSDKKGYYLNEVKNLYFSLVKNQPTEILVKFENINLLKDVKSEFKGNFLSVKVFREQDIRYHDVTRQVNTVLCTLFLTLFFVHLIIFFFHSKDKSNLFFAILNLSLTIAFYLSLVYFYKATAPKAVDNFLIFNIFIGIASLSSLFNYIFGSFKIRFWLVLIGSGILLFISRLYNDRFVNIATVLALGLVFAESLLLLIKAYRNKTKGAGILLTGLCIALIILLIGVVLYFNLPKALEGFSGLLLIIGVFSILFSISAFLASQIARTNENLERQIYRVEKLSNEKQHILETQNERLEKEVNERTAELTLEKKKSDDLLLNILPQEIAEELKEKGSTQAQYYEEVSVIFTDFVNFTSISENLGAEELLHELNENFTAFDIIMERHGLEKIKTIGDAYLAVSGLPKKKEDHAQAAVMAAIDILKYVEDRKSKSKYALDIRIGINSGALVAGIIGVKKFAYDIWGDTVNTAARMEQSGESGKINVSESTFLLIKEEFDCEHRGKISAKGKGKMDMYFVNKRANEI